jgi:hypothetical protein
MRAPIRRSKGLKVNRAVLGELVEKIDRAFAAASASGADAKLHGELLDGAHAASGAFAHLAFGDSVADANVHVDNVNDNYYRSQVKRVLLL